MQKVFQAIVPLTHSTDSLTHEVTLSPDRHLANFTSRGLDATLIRPSNRFRHDRQEEEDEESTLYKRVRTHSMWMSQRICRRTSSVPFYRPSLLVCCIWEGVNFGRTGKIRRPEWTRQCWTLHHELVAIQGCMGKDYIQSLG